MRRLTFIIASALAGAALIAPAGEARTIYVTSNVGGCGGSVGTAIKAIDSTTGAVKDIPGFGGPASIVISPDGKRAYVANQLPAGIAVLDTATDSIIATIPTASSPCGLAISPDGTRLYMTNTPAGAVGVIDATTNTVLAPITIPSGSDSASSVASLPDNGRMYVGNSHDPTSVTPVKLPEQTVLPKIEIGPALYANDETITPDGLNLFTANGSSGAHSVSQINTAAGTAGAPIVFPGMPGILSVAATPDNSRIYAGSAAGVNRLFGVDVATGTEITTGGLPLDLPAAIGDLAVTPDGAFVFVTTYGDQLLRISTATNSVVGPPIPITDPTSIAIVPDQPPVAALKVTPAAPGGATKFDSSGSTDPDGSIARYDWDFGDGTTAPNGGPTTSHVYKKSGAYPAKLTLTDNEGGSTARVFTGQAMLRNGGPSAAATKTADTLPVISALSMRNKAFAVAARKKAKVRRGSAFRYTLDEKATVKFSIERKLKGRKSGKKCKAQTRKNRSKKKCTRYKNAGSLSAAGKAGKNTTKFSGKVKNKKLKRGAYRAVAVATDSAKGKSAAKTVSFKVRK